MVDKHDYNIIPMIQGHIDLLIFYGFIDGMPYLTLYGLLVSFVLFK